MENRIDWKQFGLRLLSYVLVAAVASSVTFFLCAGLPSKLEQLEELIDEKFIGQADKTVIEDAAAQAMVDALGDRWSYYIPADAYASYLENKNNAYVGIGITISGEAAEEGFLIQLVEPDGPAKSAGILPGDLLSGVDGKPVKGLPLQEVSAMVAGEAGTKLTVQILRDGQTLDFTLTRATIQVQVATAQMLENNIGLVTIRNFNDKCAQESIEAIDALVEQGAQKLIFDVRNNPGGYLHELKKVLDHLLPEGVIYRSVDYAGVELVEYSEESCIQLPMAVLINGESYSAAEFFAAALEEYDWAVTVGQPSCGKGYFQNTYNFSDGSAVGLSVGKYFTPKGVSLAEVGGLVPQIPAPVDEQTAALIYAGVVDPADDPQIQAAVDALTQ